MWIPSYIIAFLYRALRDVRTHPKWLIKSLIFPKRAIKEFGRSHRLVYRMARVRFRMDTPEGFYHLVTHRDSTEYASYVQELHDSAFYQNLAEQVRTMELMEGARPTLRGLNPGHLTTRGKPEPGLLLYSLVRAMKPGTVVETGVANGFTSAIILKALEMNNHGTLHSIDVFPKRESQAMAASVGIFIPEGAETGWLVPTALESRWQYIEGEATTALPALLNDLEWIDMFFHDSHHSYDHVLFEYRLAWEHLRSNGVLLSDDVGPGFAHFQGATGSSGAVYDFLGACLKPKIDLLQDQYKAATRSV